MGEPAGFKKVAAAVVAQAVLEGIQKENLAQASQRRRRSPAKQASGEWRPRKLFRPQRADGLIFKGYSG